MQETVHVVHALLHRLTCYTLIIFHSGPFVLDKKGDVNVVHEMRAVPWGEDIELWAQRLVFE